MARRKTKIDESAIKKSTKKSTAKVNKPQKVEQPVAEKIDKPKTVSKKSIKKNTISTLGEFYM